MRQTLFLIGFLLCSVSLSAQKLYEGTETIEGFEIQWSVWNTSNYRGFYSVEFQVFKTGVSYAYFTIDLTVSDGTKSKTEKFYVSLSSGKSTYYDCRTGIAIVDPDKKLKTLKFSNMVITSQQGGNSVNKN